MMLIVLLSIFNLLLRFKELTEFDREQFSIQSNKAKQESQLQIYALAEHTEYTIATLNDLEILKC